jgi:hypothetical protein
MDYAFAPGQEFGDLRTVLKRRPQTTLVDANGVATVADFLNYLKTNSLKGGNLIIGSHGTDEGVLQIALDIQSAVPTTFEVLKASTKITLDASVRSADTSVFLFGCLLGSQECLPLITLMKQKLGNPKSVNAPRYVHATHSIDGANFFELMRYDFRILSKAGFTTRDDLVKAFHDNTDFKYYIDNPPTPIPPANWNNWIPPSPQLKPLDSTISYEINLSFPVTINPAIGSVTTLVDKMADWISSLEVFTEFGLPMTGAIPTDVAGKAAFAKQALGQDPLFGPLSATNPYPVYTRYHLKSLQDFADGWNWTITPSASAGHVDFKGTRYRYELLIPVTKTGASNELIYNYYPDSGSATINFHENDTRLYGVV